MKVFRKGISFLLAASIAGTVFLSGCTSKEPQTSKEVTTPKTEVETKKTETPETPEPKKELEHVTLKLVYPGNTPKDQDIVVAKINEYLKDKINASIEIERIEWGSWGQRTPLMIQSGEQVDIMWRNGDGYYSLINQKALHPLDDLIDQFAPDIKDIMFPPYLEGPRVDGKLYGLPVNKEAAAAEQWYFRKDLTDKYNIDFSNVKVMRDLEPFFETIKKNEGIAPVFVSKGEWVPRGLYALPEDQGRYGRVEGARYLFLDGQEGKMMFEYDIPEHLEVAKITREWYQKGYINQDAHTSQESGRDVGEAGKLWALKGNVSASGPAGYGEWVKRELLMPETCGKTPEISTNSTTGSMAVIPITSVDPERAMMLLNLLYTDEYLINLLIYGIEGKHFEKVNDDQVRRIDGVTNEDWEFINWTIGNSFIKYVWESEPRDTWDMNKKFNESAKLSPTFGFYFDVEPVRTEIAAVNNVFAKYDVILKTGVADTEEAVEKIRKSLKENGYDKIVEEAQRQYDAWKAKN